MVISRMTGWRLGSALVGMAACAGVGAGWSSAQAATVTYRVDFDVTWSTQSHPGAFPAAAHFDTFAGFTHNDSVKAWEVGQLASPGMKSEAESGSSTILLAEMQALVDGGDGHGVIDISGWICPPETVNAACIPPTFEFEIDDAFPLVSLAAMIGPSPDWFVGVDSLQLHDASGWTPQVAMPIFPFDAGTRSNNGSFDLFGPENDPPEAISQITDNSRLIGPDSLGTMTFTLVPEPASAAVLGLAGLLLTRRRAESALGA